IPPSLVFVFFLASSIFFTILVIVRVFSGFVFTFVALGIVFFFTFLIIFFITVPVGFLPTLTIFLINPFPLFLTTCFGIAFSTNFSLLRVTCLTGLLVAFFV